MHCGYRERLTGELRNVDMRSSGYDDSITWNQLSGTDQQQVANSYVACFNIVHGPAGDAMSHARSGVLEGSDCVGCSALSVPLQRFASGLHQHDDEAGKRLPQNRASSIASVAARATAKPPDGTSPPGCNPNSGPTTRPPEHQTAS